MTLEEGAQQDENSWVSFLKSSCWDENVTAGTGPNFVSGETVWPSMPAAALLILATEQQG